MTRVVGELSSCRDGGRWRIFLRTGKSGKPAFLPIPAELKAALVTVSLPRGCGEDSHWFFWNGVSSERAMKGIAERSLAAVFRSSMVPCAHAQRFRHTLATELLGNGASFEEVADILGNSPEIVRKHYAKWSLPGSPVSTTLWRGCIRMLLTVMKSKVSSRFKPWIAFP